MYMNVLQIVEVNEINRAGCLQNAAVRLFDRGLGLSGGVTRWKPQTRRGDTYPPAGQ